MVKYKLTEGGVKDTETGACIPFAEGNRHYKEYLEWVANGGVADPEFTQEELDKQELDRQFEEKDKLIKKKMRELAIKELKKEGLLPEDFKDR